MPSIDPRISIGHIIQIGAFVVALAVGWTYMRAAGETAASTLTDHEVRLRALEREVMTGLSRIETRLSQIDQSIARQQRSGR